jgi:hypothetical protein
MRYQTRRQTMLSSAALAHAVFFSPLLFASFFSPLARADKQNLRFVSKGARDMVDENIDEVKWDGKRETLLQGTPTLALGVFGEAVHPQSRRYSAFGRG